MKSTSGNECRCRIGFDCRSRKHLKFFSVGPQYRYDQPYHAVVLWKLIVDLLNSSESRSDEAQDASNI